MTTVPPIGLIPNLLMSEDATTASYASSGVTHNADAPATPGSGLSGLVDLFVNKRPSSGPGSAADVWMSCVKIPPLDLPRDDD